MTAFGHIVLLLGMIAWAVGNVMFLAVVYRYSPGWFLGCLFVPFAPLFYFLLYPRQTWKPTLLAAVGMLAAGVGTGLAYLLF